MVKATGHNPPAQSSKKIQSSTDQRNGRLPDTKSAAWPLWVAIAVLALTIMTSVINFGDDGMRWLTWSMSLLIIALPTLPLALRIFKSFPQIAFPLSMALGLLVLSFCSWTLSYLHILPFRRWSLILLLVILTVLFWFKKSSRDEVIRVFSDRHTLLVNIVFVTLFIVGLSAWTYVRGLMPQVDGLEKFMDYGFMMSMMRTEWLPAKDMWLAGESINYYYYGQFVYTAISKLTGIMPQYSYNLSMATTLAYMLMLSGSIGWMLFTALNDSFLRKTSPVSRFFRWFASFAAAFFVTIAGNSHSFFYSDNGPGKGLLRFASNLGIDVGQFDSFFFADSTRYIGYNPDVADKTIHEFPYYSFLVSDLHAHVANTVFVLLLIALLIAYYHPGGKTFIIPTHTSGRMSSINGLKHFKSIVVQLVTEPSTLLAGLLLGVFMMCNFWDFAIYFVVILFVFFSRNLADEVDKGGIAGLGQIVIILLGMFIPFIVIEHPLLALCCYLITVFVAYNMFIYKRNAYSRSGLQLSLVFFLAHLFSLPFNLNFEAISKTIKLTSNRSTPQQLAILWGAHILAAILFSVILILRAKRNKKDDTDAVSSTFLQRAGGSWLIVLLAISGIGLILAAELIYVRDIYEAYYARANTMFKFTYQAFIMLSLVLGVALPSMLARVTILISDRKQNPLKLSKLIPALLVSAVILYGSIMPAYYPFVASPGWIPNPKTTDWIGLDGTVWMDQAETAYGNISGESEYYDLTVDAAAIRWLNDHVNGQPTILEAAGLSYTHLNRISAYTGLPTILGWETHEWLWRTSKDSPHAYAQLVYPKQEDVKAVYTWSDEERALNVLREGKVEYIIIGELELLRYPDIDLDRLAGLGETVFHQGLMRIIKINPYTIS